LLLGLLAVVMAWLFYLLLIASYNLTVLWQLDVRRRHE